MSFRGIIRLSATISLLAVAFCHGQTTASCTYSTFKPPHGYVGANLNGVNDHTAMVGTVIYEPNPYSLYYYGLIRYSNGNMNVYNYPNAVQTFLTRQNYAGVTVGYFEDGVGQFHGMVKSGKHAVVVDYPAAGKPNTFLTGINQGGTIVGRYLTYVKEKPYFSGFELHNGKFSRIWYPNSTDTEPQAINGNGVVAGWYTDSPRNQGYTFFRGFLLHNGTYKELDDPQGRRALGTQLNDVNAVGVIAGNYVTSDSNGENQLNGFIYENGAFENLAYPGAISTAALGINDYKTVVGIARVPPSDSYTFIPFKAQCN